jgi:D-inositol-3-phosphate glycosyltransferase
LKILIIGPAYPLRGGLASFDERLAKTYADAGHEVEILTFSLQYPGFLFPGKTQYSTEPPPPGLKINVALNSVNPFNWIKTGLHYKKKNFDIAIFRFWMPFMGPSMGTIARIISSNDHTRIIAIADNVVPHEKRIGDLPFTKYFLRGCDGFIAMSKSVMKDLSKFAPGKPKTYCPHPMYDNFGEPLPKGTALSNLGLSPSFKYLLFFGFIRKYKGLDLLLQAFADERLRALPLKLIIAGEYYEDPEPYRQMIRDLNLSEHVIEHTDFIPDSKVGNYFSAADLVVQTYKSATQSGVTQIAYYFNKPMLVTDVGGLAEMVPHGKVGYVVPPSPAPVADAILDYFNNHRESEYARNIGVEKLKFTWEALATHIKELSDVENEGITE